MFSIDPTLPMLSTLRLLPMLSRLPLLPMLRMDAKLPTLSSDAALARLSTLANDRIDHELRELKRLVFTIWLRCPRECKAEAFRGNLNSEPATPEASHCPRGSLIL